MGRLLSPCRRRHPVLAPPRRQQEVQSRAAGEASIASPRMGRMAHGAWRVARHTPHAVGRISQVARGMSHIAHRRLRASTTHRLAARFACGTSTARNRSHQYSEVLTRTPPTRHATPRAPWPAPADGGR
ncbi:hypothetical protein DIJ62_33480 [Burkholderia pseudomallei]|nr:hypothetical protein DIJ62_33480 [Burkholderia pseudomallei]